MPSLTTNNHKWSIEWVSEWLVFYVAFNKLSVISRRWLLVAWDAIYARTLSAANTDAPCRRHKTRIHHPVTLSWHRASQSWFYPLNAERLARKQPVPSLTPLLWRGHDSNPRPSDYEANALSTRPPNRYLLLYMYPLSRIFEQPTQFKVCKILTVYSITCLY